MKSKTLKRLTGILAVTIAIAGMSLGSVVNAAASYTVTGDMPGTYTLYNKPFQNFFGEPTVKVMSYSAFTKYAYFKLNTLPALGSGAYIRSAKVTFYSVGDATPITLSGCNRTWDLNTIAYMNGEPGTTSDKFSVNVPSGILQAPTPVTVDITMIVWKWYSGLYGTPGENTGLCLYQDYLSSHETTLLSTATIELDIVD